MTCARFWEQVSASGPFDSAQGPDYGSAQAPDFDKLSHRSTTTSTH
ncbi:MAG TPA: hypothetical protein VIH22_14790 [Cyclobacteriaceae bacterium]